MLNFVPGGWLDSFPRLRDLKSIVTPLLVTRREAHLTRITTSNAAGSRPDFFKWDWKKKASVGTRSSVSERRGFAVLFRRPQQLLDGTQAANNVPALFAPSRGARTTATGIGAGRFWVRLAKDRRLT